MPKISIIIPIYKVEYYLPACLDSVLKQTFQDWEAICVNDGSPDKCGEILAEYSQKDNRIKVINQENQGLSMARNNGLKKADGKYILFLDSDDSIHPQLLEICSHVAEKENADMVSFNFQNHKKDDALFVPNYMINEIKSILTDTPLYFQKKRHKHKITVNAWSKLYKKDLIQDLSFIPGITMEDYPHTYAVLAKHPKTVLLDIPLYYYRYNPQSISSTQIAPKNIQDYQTGLNFIIDVYSTASKKEKHFVLHELFPNILKQQLNKIVKSPKDKQPELYRAFSKELKDLDEKGWLKACGHKFSRFLAYKRLVKEAKNETMNIAFCFNDGYTDRIAVTMLSLIVNSPNTLFEFYCFSSDLSEQNIKRLGKLVSCYKNNKIHVIPVNKQAFSKLKITIPYIAIESYFRYIIADHLPELDKMLYLDGDLVVNGSLSDFYHTDLGNNYLAGALDKWVYKLGDNKALNIDPYINAGVLLMNLKKMREEGLGQKLIQTTIDLQDKIKYQDQDILNFVCRGGILVVDNIYNFTAENIKTEKKKRKQAIVIHYTGEKKPWGNKKVRLASIWKKYNRIWKSFLKKEGKYK